MYNVHVLWVAIILALAVGVYYAYTDVGFNWSALSSYPDPSHSADVIISKVAHTLYTV